MPLKKNSFFVILPRKTRLFDLKTYVHIKISTRFVFKNETVCFTQFFNKTKTKILTIIFPQRVKAFLCFPDLDITNEQNRQ